MVTEGGMYVLQLFDAYSGNGSVLLVVVFCESLAIGWLYGEKQFIAFAFFHFWVKCVVNSISSVRLEPYRNHWAEFLDETTSSQSASQH